MSKLWKIGLAALCCLVLAGPAFGQSSTFIVDDDGDPLTTYPDLATAIATAVTFPGGPHVILIMPGSYSDAGLSYTAGKIGDIGGAVGSDPADVVFTAPAGGLNFLAMQSDLFLHNMTMDGYANALTGNGLSGVVIQDVVINGASGVGLNVSNWTNGVLDGFAFSNLDYGMLGTTWSGAVVQNGSFTNCGIAIDATDCDNGLFDVLTMTGGNYGLVLRPNSHPNTLTGSTISGVANDGVWLDDANVNMSGCKVEGSGGYAVNKHGAGGYTSMTVQDNCFSGNTGGTAQAYDDVHGTWTHNYWSDLAFPGASYTLDGTASDGDPWRAENQPDGPTAVSVLSTVDVDFNWVLPDCDQVQYLAAYEFTVTWDASKLEYVSADYDEAFLGGTADGALYTPIGGNPATGSLIFAATNFSLPGEGNGRLALAQFNAIDVGTVEIKVESEYRDEGNNQIPVKKPISIFVTISDNDPPVVTGFSVWKDAAGTEAPIVDGGSGLPTFSDGSTAGAGPFVKMYVEATATDNFDLDRIQCKVEGDGQMNLVTGLSGVSGGTVAPVYISLLPGLFPTEGPYTLQIRARDAAGLWSEWTDVEYDFAMDFTGPTLTTVLLSDFDGCALDPEYTNELTIGVTLTDDGTAEKMQIWDAGSPGWQVPPIDYLNPSDYTLLNSAQGSKQVYYRLYDAYGNMGNQASDMITFDDIAPVPSNFELAGGALKTSTAIIDGDVNHGGTDAAEHAVSLDQNDLVCGSGAWRPDRPHPITPIDLGSPDGNKVVYYASRDLAGNISAILSDDIDLDTDAPDMVSFTVEDLDGDECSDNWTVNVIVEWSDADVKEVHLGMAGSGGPYPTAVSLVGETSPKTIAYMLDPAFRTCDALNMVYGVLIDDVDYGTPNQGAEMSDDLFVDCYVPTIAGIELSWDGNTVWSQSATVDVTLSGFAADIVEVRMGEVSGTYTTTVPFDPGDPVVQFTFAAPTTTDYLYLVGVDCAGRVSAEVFDGMKFDLIDPVISGVLINNGDLKTNNPAVTVDFSATEANPQTIWMSEDPGIDPGHPTTVSMGWVGGPPKPFTLSTGDGTKFVYVKLVDKSGRESTIEFDDIGLDEQVPSGAMTVQQIPATNPYATAGYTNALTGIEAVGITADPDVVEMQIQAVSCAPNPPSGSNSNWVPLAGTYQPISLDPDCGQGPHTVRIRFKDDAANIGAWVNYTIIYDATPPPAPATAFGMPTASLHITWAAVAEAQSYILRYNFSGEYPHYSTVNPPPHPMTMGEGIAMTEVDALEYDFPGPHPDMYAVSIWTRDLAGNKSTTPNTDVVGTNYILGDFYTTGDPGAMGPDGCIDFADEFGALASAYNSVPADPNWFGHLDIAPTTDGNPLSCPVPDLYIGFEDLIIFALNYVDHRCGAGGTWLPLSPKTSPAAPVVVKADVPSFVSAGDMVTVPVFVENASSIRGYHVVLDYNTDNFELVSVKPGAAYGELDKSFFYYDRKATTIDVSGAVFDDDNRFVDGALFVVELRANHSTGIDLSARELVCRDDMNADIDVDFGVHVVQAQATLPSSFALAQNYPNPFNAATVITLHMPQEGDYTLEIYNILGQSVASFSGHATAGTVDITWDAAEQTSGLYLYRMTAGEFQQTRKMVLLK